MALQVGELFSKLEIRTEGAEKSLDQHHRALQQTAQQAERTEKAVAGIGQIIAGAGNQARSSAGQFTTMGQGVQSAGRQAGTTGNVFQRLGQTITGAVGGALSLGNAMRGAGQTAGQLERGVDSGSRSLREMANASGQTEGALARVNSVMSNIIATATGFIMAQVVMRAVGAVSSFVKDAFIGMNDTLEQTQIAFTTMLGSAEAAESFLSDIADFAARTPFDFPGLLTAAQRMMAYGFSAQEVLPLLENIGNVSAGLGAGAAGVDRMTLALGQMTAKGKVQTQELLQLTELGVPAFQLLADALDMTVGEVQELVSAGEVSSDVFLRIFSEWSRANFGDMMAKQSRTFTGAMSNISDVMQMAIARGLEPFFNALRDGAIRVSEFLETRRFEDWVTTLQQVSQAVVDALMSIPGTATAFRDWVSNILSGGVSLNEFLGTLPGWFYEALGRIQDMMGIGGHNAIVAYAQGIVDSASTYVTQAINYVADLVASYLVGQSPPPEGPLSQIDKAGENLMETYTDGMVKGAAGAERAGESVLDAMRRLDEQAGLDNAQAGLQAAAGNLEAMEAVAGDVEQKIKDINRETSRIDLELAGIDREIEAINDAYDETLKPLQEQLELLEKQRDLQAEKLQLEHDLQKAQVQAAQLAALGDPERRAEIAGELALLDIEQERIDNAAKIAEINAQLEGGAKELTAEERERLELESRNLTLRRAETLERMRTAEDLTALERARLQLTLDQIDADIRANAAKRGGTPEELSDAERQRLEMQRRELELRQELLDMIDAEAAAQAEADAALLESKQKERDLIEEIADIQSDIAKIPILEEIEKVEAARRAELEPLELQRAALEEQRKDLDYLRQQWQFLAGDVNEALTPLREAARLQEQMAKDAERQRKELERAAKEANKRPDNSFEASQARLRGEGSCPAGYVMDEFGRCFNPAEEAWKEAIKESGQTGPGGLVMPEMPTWSEMFPDKDELEIPVKPVVKGADGDNLSLDMLGPQPKSLGTKIGELMAAGMIDGIGNYIRDNVGKILGTAVGASAGGAIFGPAGYALGGLLGGLIGDGLQEALGERGIDTDVLVSGLEDRVQPAIESFVGFVSDHVIPTVGRLADWFSGDGMSAAESFGATVRMVWQDWVQPAINRVVRDTLPALQSAWARITETVGPALENVGRLFRWVAEQVDIHSGTVRRVVDTVWSFVSQLINNRITNISQLIATVMAVIGGDWGKAWENLRGFVASTWDYIRIIVGTGIIAIQKFVTDALPVIIAKLQEWGMAFVDWLGPQIPILLEKAGELLVALGNWIVNDALPAIWDQLTEWGAAFINWIGPQIEPMLAELYHLLGSLIDWIVTAALPGIIENLAKWGYEFLAWVGPQIPPLLEELGKLLWSLGDWIVTTALPEIVTKLKDWGGAFLGWIASDVLPYIVEKLGILLSDISSWIVDTAAPELVTKLKEWASAFLDFVKDDVLPFLGEKLADVLTAIKDWVTDSVSDVKDSVKDIGTSIVEGIWEGIKDSGSWLVDKLTTWVDDNIPGPIKKALELFSPSRVTARIGQDVVRGLMVGVDDQAAQLAGTMRGVANMMADNASISIPRVSSQMAMPAMAGAAASGNAGQPQSGVRDIIIPIYDSNGDLREKYIVDVVNQHAQKVYG